MPNPLNLVTLNNSHLKVTEGDVDHIILLRYNFPPQLCNLYRNLLELIAKRGGVNQQVVVSEMATEGFYHSVAESRSRTGNRTHPQGG